ncbi:MAG: ABC transporter permease subunit [Gammaproteobacteria bacterium]|nr:ABC transporter permease subunit [Gammaproteobacteria bacterium]
MQDILQSLVLAVNLVFSGDSDLFEIIGLSLRVSFSAVVCSVVLGLPLGSLMAVGNFRGRQSLMIVLNSLMGLPPVVVGLVVYLFLSRSGPLGWMELLYTPTAMIIAQVVLITPIIAALSQEILSQLYEEYDEQFRSLNVPRWIAVRALLWDARFNLVTVSLAGFGRAVAEVGAVMIVGGNIDHLTRVMTTAIALETSKGNLALALALGLILITISLIVNASLFFVKIRSEQHARSQ